MDSVFLADERLEDSPVEVITSHPHSQGTPLLSEEQRHSIKRLLMTLYPELDLDSLMQAFFPGPEQGVLFPHRSGKPR
jgi:hypothetical protein